MIAKKRYFVSVVTALTVVALLAFTAGCGEVAQGTPIDNNSQYGVAHNTADFQAVEDFSSLPQEVQDWIDLYRTHGGMDTLTVDGSTYVVVALGERPTGGFSVDVTQIEDVEAGSWTVWYSVNAPKKGAMVTQVITYPVAAVKLSATNLDFTFQQDTGDTGQTRMVQTGSATIDSTWARNLQAFVDSGHSQWLTDPLIVARRMGIAYGFSASAEYQLGNVVEKGEHSGTGEAEVTVKQDGQNYVIQLIQPNGPAKDGVWVINSIRQGD